jgi:hypothetical protein
VTFGPDSSSHALASPRASVESCAGIPPTPPTRRKAPRSAISKEHTRLADVRQVPFVLLGSGEQKLRQAVQADIQQEDKEITWERVLTVAGSIGISDADYKPWCHGGLRKAQIITVLQCF